MNYIKRAALLCCSCYIVLLAVSLIPPQSLFGVELRRANVLSDLLSFDADNVLPREELIIDVAEYEVDLEAVEREVEAAQSMTPEVESSYSWPSEEVAADSLSHNVQLTAASTARLLEGVELTPIEDLDTTELSSLQRFYRKLLSPDSLVRIAVMGDSFIEADIITADLRELLQNQYGGCGAGFAPMHSPLTKYRQTIKTEAKGWSSHNVMQHSKTPEPYNSLFSISGWVSLPSAGATTTWHTTSARAHIDSCQCVRLHFMALKQCALEVSINGEQSRRFDIEGGEVLRQIVLNHNSVKSVSVKLLSGHEGFVGYGAIFEGDSGVVVDNYSVRSNNGQAMFWTAPAINAQIDRAVGGYDLVILQYGLNIMQSGVSKYTSYSQQVEKMITYVQKCFPRAAIIVMGVSDRSTKKDGLYKPMPEAVSLNEYQRTAAQNRGVGYWSTYAAMQRQGSMSRFVENGWAAKDFTHINLKGGRQIALALRDAIVEAAEEERKYIVEKVEYEPIVDSMNRAKVEERLLGNNPTEMLP